MPYDELIRKHLENLKEKIIFQMSSKGIDNTGAASASLEVKDNELLGYDYIYFIDKGRRPGRFPPVNIIRDWVRSKLGISEERENNSVAFLVGRKIANEGTNIYQNQSRGIELDRLVEETLNELQKELPEYAATEALKYLNYT